MTAAGRLTADPKVTTVVGIGADGWDGLSPQARELLRAADVIMGSERQLGLLSGCSALRVPWPSPMLPALPQLLDAHHGRAVCVLASGDPMFFGIGATLARLLGPEHVRIVAHPSSVSLACARLGWPAEHVEVVSVVGRPLELLHPAVLPGRRLLVLSEDATTPARVAGLLRARGYGASPMSALERLGAADERVLHGTAATWEHAPGAALNVVAVECAAGPGAPLLPRTPGLPDDAFEHDGQLTKREVRAVTFSWLAPVPGQLLWDVGAGSGSIAIEWMRSHPACRAVAIEARADRAARIGRNAAALGVPGLRIVHGAAPQALSGLERPSAVFVGGGVSRPGIIAACWEALLPGGRLVANAVTVQAETVLAGWYEREGGELVRLSVHRAAAVGGFTGWRPAMPITQWAVAKPWETTP